MIIQWIIIVIFILVGASYIKMEHHSRKIAIVLMVIIGALIYFSFVGLFTSKQVDLTSPRGVINAVYIYFGWIGQTATNLWDIGVETTHTVGNAIKINNTETKSRR
ncbi:MAG: hypothetical protein KJ592_04525 [Nanoarchaeota archaeon]|nr:hypothetical protein [Nanoarchaeota archaeon]